LFKSRPHASMFPVSRSFVRIIREIFWFSYIFNDILSAIVVFTLLNMRPEKALKSFFTYLYRSFVVQFSRYRRQLEAAHTSRSWCCSFPNLPHAPRFSQDFRLFSSV